MQVANEYEKIPADLSGSISKNRFRLEMLWGASKMFDLFDRDDFCVIFDYKCDVEVHFSDALEFYQLKTHKVQSPYAFSKLSKRVKEKPSIMGKLFAIKNAADPSAPIKVAIVSNSYLKIENTVYSDYEELEFASLEKEEQEKIKKALKAEIGESIDLTNVGFIYTSMDLFNPDNDLRGKIVGSFEKIMGGEPNKPNALFRLIKDTVESKACYEMKSSNYDELKRNKGITKQELYEMLCKHSIFVDNAIEDAGRFIDTYITEPVWIRRYKTSLVRITQLFSSSVELRQKEEIVSKDLSMNEENLPDNQLDTLNMLYNKYQNSFSIEYSESDKKVFLLIVLLKWEAGKYE